MKTQTVQHKTFEALKGQFHYKSIMQAPKVSKIVVATGVGAKHDPKKREVIKNRLARITGQAPAERLAKKSIATFKIRAGDTVGYQVTLRGARAQSFLDKIIHIVLPRSKDFRGIKPETIDEMGNITIGFKENIVFPETSDEDSKDIFGLAVTIVTTAKNKKEAEAFLRYLGLPLREGKTKK
ncbi:MAG: 50S ribosomal protein L5 [Candidatus Kaiserbacteria bacterium GW2011_GWA2_49_19]|uniref:Large ribosomal subunit protein uL5 n=2 Tax=Candidatus Kaiseribacteriota TaxID=1752734 RepID=A0A0G1VQA5_9BACT|nr:MAG: 50S ribosomal protein L5 [Candidatus Kaiserbacteria bacterium GW2011_GWA2_49_19]OGG60929.1 MAG: 50S ribosomal protein L5 [Candidatus Kaiserbacteria bacterium RIFCSPHIGHO2_02_FULL_49_16]